MTFAPLCLSLLLLAPQGPPDHLVNPDFREGTLGKLPTGWAFPESCKAAGFRAELGGDANGRWVDLIREKGSGSFGNLLQGLDAKPFRGKRIRVTTRLRVARGEEEASQGQVWVRVDLPGGNHGFFDNMDDRPVTVDAWSPAVVVGDVAPDAERIMVGAMLTRGNGRLRIAPFTLEVLGDTPVEPAQGPKALTPTGLANLEAFARAYGYVRFFHPSDEGAQAKWADLAVEGVRAVEGAATPKELARRLNVFFAPYAPTARFLAPGERSRPLAAPAGGVKVVRWEHHGFGQVSQGGIYRSTRESLAPAAARAKGWSDPAKPAVLPLERGVRLQLPTVCWADAAGTTLPRTARVSAKAAPGMPRPTAGDGDARDRGTRLGATVLAWNVFRHFFPYFDVTGVPWDPQLSRTLEAAALDPDPRAFARTLRRMTATLHDGHVWVSGPGTPPKAWPSVALTWVEDSPVVQAVGASAKAVPAGSRILAVDGVEIQVRMAQLSEEISAATPGWRQHSLARVLLAGAPGTPAELTYQTALGEKGTAQLIRDQAIGPFVAEPGHAPLEELASGIWYVNLDRVEEPAFQEALSKLAAARGVIFDLRGYPHFASFLQHLTRGPINSAKWNVPVVTDPLGRGTTWDGSGRWDLEPLTPFIGGKVAFLTGGGAISFAESCLGIVEAYHLAEIVGAPSAGTNGNVNPFTVPGGFRISWTGMKVLKHDGSRHHGVGIRPTVPVGPTQAGLAAGRDEVLEKALEIVSN